MTFKLKVQQLSETVIVAQIFNLLRHKKIKAWRVYNGGVYDKKINGYRKPGGNSMPGAFDISGMLPGGHRLEIEAKTKSELEFILRNYEMLSKYYGTNKKYNHYRDQIAFKNMINGGGGVAFFASSDS